MSSWWAPASAMYLAPHCANPTPWPKPFPSRTTTGMPVWARAGNITAQSAATVKKRTKTPLRTVLIRSEADNAAHGPPGSFFDDPTAVSCLVHPCGPLFDRDGGRTVRKNTRDRGWGHAREGSPDRYRRHRSDRL